MIHYCHDDDLGLSDLGDLKIACQRALGLPRRERGGESFTRLKRQSFSGDGHDDDDDALKDEDDDADFPG